MMKHYLLSILLLTVSTLNAEVKDKWKINIGSMHVTNFETEMQITPRNIPLSAKINTKDQLGMSNETNVFRLDGYYRFTDKHRVSISYFSVKSEGGRSIDRDIKFNDKNISAGASVDSYFNMDIYKVNYDYSFYHSDEVELSLSAGFHITALDIGLYAQGTIDGTPAQTLNAGSAITVPLPVFGFKGEYTVIDKRLFVNYAADYFFLAYDDISGSLVSTYLGLEYRFTDNIGLGVGFNSNDLSLEADNGNTRVDVSNSIRGIATYLTYVY